MFNRPKQAYSITKTDKKDEQSDAVFSVEMRGCSYIYEQDISEKINTDGFNFSIDNEKVNISVHLNSTNFSDANTAFRFAVSKACENRLISLRDLDEIVQQYTSFREKNGFEIERQSRAGLGFYRPDGNAY